MADAVDAANADDAANSDVQNALENDKIDAVELDTMCQQAEAPVEAQSEQAASAATGVDGKDSIDPAKIAEEAKHFFCEGEVVAKDSFAKASDLAEAPPKKRAKQAASAATGVDGKDTIDPNPEGRSPPGPK